MEGSAKKQRTCKNDGIAGSASFTHTTKEGQGVVVNSSRYEYEVFLSFRGKDTRRGFTSFLYTTMIDVGIRVYKDDKELRKGEKFGPELLQAISESKISIPIFSKGYASSTWCLKELVQMVKCQKIRGQKIMPIFYDVAPSEVRHQTKGYEEAFLSHENKKRYDEATIREWKAALNAVGELDGWDLQSIPKREEGEIAKTITREVFNELKKAYLVVSNNLVNMDDHVGKIMEEIGAHTSETRIVGIHGMGGVGKTTIAKIIFNELSNKYNNCCFLSNIRETSKLKGIEYLQQQLISDILKTKWMDIRNIDAGIKTIKDRFPTHKALILLDDVEEKDHMDALVGKRDWFGEGSKLIITTRRKDVLHVPEVDWTYELMGMDPHQSLQLFSKHAFRRDSPLDEYINHAKRAIHIAGGLPLTLEVIGSLLSSKNKDMWDATLNLLESVPHDKVQNKLKISYDALDCRQKHIFLDIACHFIGYRKDIVVIFWDASKLFPEATLEVLQNMSLIKIEKHNKLWMHDQLRDLGREIVRQESKMKIEKQRCVWNPKEGLDLLKSHEMKKKVEALHLKFDNQHHFTYEDFKNLPNLTFLEVEHLWHTRPLNILSTNVFQMNSNLLPQLRWLSLHNIHPTFEITNFSMENVIILDLSKSEITEYWKGWSHMKVIKNLKVLDLAYCQHLKITPDLSTHSKLECLNLSGCESLIEIDRSVCQLKCLVFLDVSYCGNLQRLPERVGNLDSLTKLDISHTSIEEVPDSIGMLKNLKVMKIYNHVQSRLYDASKGMIWGWQGVHALPRLPKSLIELELEELRVDPFPDLSNLANLKVLLLRFGPPNCDGKSYGLLEEPIPRWIGNLTKLESLELRFPRMTASSTDLSLPRHPRGLPRLPSNLSSLILFGCDSLCSMDLSNLRKLSSLEIRYSLVAEIEGLGCLENLQRLSLHCLGPLAMLPDLSKLNKLRHLDIQGCHNLVEIQGELPRLLDQLTIYSCDLLQEFPNLFGVMGKTFVFVHIRNQTFEKRGGHALMLHGLKQMQIPDLSNRNRLTHLLTHLTVGFCHNLVEIQGELPQSLKVLWIQCCESLQKLPDLSSLKGLQKVVIIRCGKLAVEEICWLCWEKSIQFVGGDDSTLYWKAF